MVTDPAGTDRETFVLTVTAVNDPPTISNFANEAIDEDITLGPLRFTIDDIDTPITRLTVTTTTSNPTLVPATSIVVGGSGSARTLTVTPAANQLGTVTIGVHVSDGLLGDVTRFTLAW